jgi:hypothetical protein
MNEPLRASKWTGWVVFGSAMLMFIGTIHIVQGLVTLLDDGYYLTTADGLAVNVDFTVLGWIQLCLGALSFAIGIGVFLGNTIALTAGVIVALVSAIVHLVTIATHPLWAVVVIMFDVIIIYSILTHGREMKALS